MTKLYIDELICREVLCRQRVFIYPRCYSCTERFLRWTGRTADDIEEFRIGRITYTNALRLLWCDYLEEDGRMDL